MRDVYVPGGTPSPFADGQDCTLFAVDIAGFTNPDRDDDICLYLHEELYRMLEKTFESSGIPWADCPHEDRGDGVLVVVPSDLACTAMIDPLPEQLRSFIRRHNHVSREAAALQLRVAVNLGPVVHDGHGFVSKGINHLFRMLAARSLKQALTSTGAELGLIVSDKVYRDVVCRNPSRVRPDAFDSIRFQVKHTRAQAWTYLPGHTGQEVALG